MGNRRHIFKNLLLGILMLLSVSICAQQPTLERAAQLYRAQKYDAAALAIDSAIVHPQTSRDFITWTQRAFIYYYIYLRTDKMKLNSKLRDTVLISVRKSIALNPDSDFVANNKRILTNLSAHYYNVSKALLQDSINYDRSLIAYNRYKELLALTDVSTNVNAKDMEYYLAVASVYSEVFGKEPTNTKAQNIAKVALLKVLEMQPDHPSANMTMGLLYYNQAVAIAKELDYGADLEKLDFLQESMVKLAKQSEPFILKVYNNDNKSRRACTALFYIYRMLNEFNKSDDFKKKAEDLGEKFTDEGQENNNPPKDK